MSVSVNQVIIYFVETPLVVSYPSILNDGISESTLIFTPAPDPMSIKLSISFGTGDAVFAGRRPYVLTVNFYFSFSGS